MEDASRADAQCRHPWVCVPLDASAVEKGMLAMFHIQYFKSNLTKVYDDNFKSGINSNL